MTYTDFEKLLGDITPNIYDGLKRAVELGKWPNGVLLTPDQRKLCMQAVIHWEQHNLSPEKRSGHIPTQASKHCGSTVNQTISDTEQPLKFR